MLVEQQNDVTNTTYILIMCAQAAISNYYIAALEFLYWEIQASQNIFITSHEIDISFNSICV